MILVIANRDDGTADRVVHELNGRGMPLMRLDAADFPQRLALAAASDARGWTGSLGGEHRRVRLEEIAGVYFRHPGQFDLAEGMSGPERLWAYTEARLGFGGVLLALDCVWINHPQRVAAAEYKPLQLSVALHSGLHVPATFIGNDPQQAMAWAQQHKGPILYKPLGGAVHVEAGTTHLVYATPVTDLTLLEDPAFQLTAHCLQQWVDKAAEARVTVVGEEMFAVLIHADSAAGHIDWRADYSSHRYEVTEVPEQVRRSLRACLDHLGLVYCAADFVITPQGEWVFVGDLNPNGEWGWLAHHCDLPIAAAIADHLQKGYR